MIQEPSDQPEIRVVASRSDAPPGSADAVWVSALGDLMLTGDWRDAIEANLPQSLMEDLVALYRGDELLFANLEVTHEGSDGTITKEPRLITDSRTLSEYLEVMRPSILNLSNNHAFDARRSGFLATRQMLLDRGVHYLGAGETPEEASRPLKMEVQGITFAWLAYTDISTRPSHIASPLGPGVNPFDLDTACEAIVRQAEAVDHIIVSLHWGIEYCHLPSPDQIAEARSLIEAGATLVIGHHAHVIQGVEAYKSGAIAYNLGNAMATDLHVGGRLSFRQTARTRSSFLMRARFTKQSLDRIELVPFQARASGISTGDPTARRILLKANEQLARGISDTQWKNRRVYEDVVWRTLRKLDPRVIRSLKLSHILTFFKNLSRSIRGQGPV